MHVTTDLAALIAALSSGPCLACNGLPRTADVLEVTKDETTIGINIIFLSARPSNSHPVDTTSSTNVGRVACTDSLVTDTASLPAVGPRHERHLILKPPIRQRPHARYGSQPWSAR